MEKLGRPGVILINPNYPHNVGQTLRACSVWGVDYMLWTGSRVDLSTMDRLPREERMKAYRDVSWAHIDTHRPFDHFCADVTPVAIELRENSENLMDFVHPPNAVYVFGPEDGSLHRGILSYCHRFVMLPSKSCLNLAAAVNVVLYDRQVKARKKL